MATLTVDSLVQGIASAPSSTTSSALGRAFNPPLTTVTSDSATQSSKLVSPLLVYSWFNPSTRYSFTTTPLLPHAIYTPFSNIISIRAYSWVSTVPIPTSQILGSCPLNFISLRNCLVSHSGVVYSLVSHSGVVYSLASHPGVVYSLASHPGVVYSLVSHSGVVYSLVSHSGVVHSLVSHSGVVYSLVSGYISLSLYIDSTGCHILLHCNSLITPEHTEVCFHSSVYLIIH